MATVYFLMLCAYGDCMRKIKLRKQRPRTITIYPAKAIFDEWLDENIHRFHYKPIVKEIRNGYAVYSFEGIINNISLVVDFWRPEAMIWFANLPEFCEDVNDMNFDHVAIEYIGEEKYHPLKGYYDADRIDHIYDYFSTQKELYINNVFEHIIEYINKMFVSENSLYLIDYSGGSTEGFIFPTDTNDQCRKLQSFTLPDRFQNVVGITVYTSKRKKMYKSDLFIKF